MDDDESVCSMYKNYFEREFDISPVTAPTVESAQAVLHEEEVDCLVSDGLRTEDGELFVDVVSRMQPELAVILCTGDPPSEHAPIEVNAVVQKGSSGQPAELAATITTTLDATAHQPPEGRDPQPRPDTAVPQETGFILERAMGRWHWPIYSKGCWGQPGVPKCRLCQLRYVWSHLKRLIT